MMKAGLVASDGSFIASFESPTAAEEGNEAVLARIVAVIRDLDSRATEMTGERPCGIGVAVPGGVDELAGVARFAANLGWRDVALAQILGDASGLSVIVRHDVRAAGLAELALGAARGVDAYLFVALGTGISGACVIGREPYPGANFLAGEIGHIVVDPNGPSCGCGARGCLETYASAAAFVRRYLERADKSEAVGEELHAGNVLELAASGDHAAKAVVDEAISALAGVLGVYQRILDPSLVVIGGGLAQAGEALIGPLRIELASRLTFQPAPRLVTSELGGTAGCIGVGIAAWRSLGLDAPTAVPQAFDNASAR
jgi:glucokinase